MDQPLYKDLKKTWVTFSFVFLKNVISYFYLFYAMTTTRQMSFVKVSPVPERLVPKDSVTPTNVGEVIDPFFSVLDLFDTIRFYCLLPHL